MPALLKDLITIPEYVAKGDFVLKLTEGTDPTQVKATLESYVVTPQLQPARSSRSLPDTL